MGCRRPFRVRLSAALIAAVSLASAPLLFGGGGDEGVDILPNLYGGRGASGPSGDGQSNGPIGRPAVGYVAVHGGTQQIDANGFYLSTGLLVAPHSRSDLFLGTPGQEPGAGVTSIDLLMKGPRKLVYGESRAPSSGGASSTTPRFLDLNGRFEFEDLRSDDRETFTLAGRERKPALLGIMIGKRSTHNGSILASFAEVDSVSTENWPSGVVDLASFRADAISELAGTGVDVAVVLYATTPRGVDEAWAAFNVDEPRRLYDIEIKVR